MYSNIIDQLTGLELVIDEWYTAPTSKILRKHSNLTQQIIDATNWLDVDTRMRDRLICIFNDIRTRPTCSCGVQLKTDRKLFRSYCSRKCKESCPELRNTSKQTCMDRYGVEYATQADVTKAKKKAIFLAKYGNEVASKSDKVKDKMIATNMDRYGVKYTTQVIKFNDNRKQTCLDRYGVEYAVKSASSISKRKKTCLDRYGTDTPLESDEIRDKIRQTNKDRYGYTNHTLKHIDPIMHTLSTDKTWLKYQHHIEKKSQTDIAHMLGMDASVISSRFIKFGIETKNFFVSSGEQQVGDMLRLHNIDFSQNDRKIISPYELDIVIPSSNLAIEYGGLYWHSEQHGKDSKYHKRKHDMCQNVGIQLITLFEDEWKERREQVTRKILQLCRKLQTSTTYARKTVPVVVNSATKSMFFNEHHIQGTGPGSITYGLQENDELVACMSFIKKSNGKYYLNRYATSHNVPGGFSKLLKHFQRNNVWTEIISFADCRWSNGGLYYKTGFTLDKHIPPDYSYTPDCNTRYHKFGYRRKFLATKLKKFDPALSERVNCDNNNVLRIWDCGKMRFVLTNRT